MSPEGHNRCESLNTFEVEKCLTGHTSKCVLLATLTFMVVGKELRGKVVARDLAIFVIYLNVLNVV